MDPRPTNRYSKETRFFSWNTDDVSRIKNIGISPLYLVTSLQPKLGFPSINTECTIE